MGKDAPAAPTPPDPTVVANAQSAANVASATAQQKLNMINSSGPSGSVSYVADPNSPGGYTQNTSLSPGQQGIYDQGVEAQNSALGVANQQIGRVGTALSQGLDPSGVTQSYDQGGPIQTQVNTPDFQTAMNDAANSVYSQETSRLDPQWQLAQTQQNDSLANQGLGANSTAYQNQQAILGRNKDDAYASAQNDAVQAAQAVQAQGYGQALSSGQFANSAQGQQNQENANQAIFGNQANAQQFGQDATAQQQPINEFDALMSSGQVSAPAGVSYTPSQVGQTDVTGAYALNSQAQQANYQSQMANQSSLMGGLFNLGAAGVKAFAA